MLETKKPRKSLNDVIPNWLLGQGIMSALTTNYDVPWKSTYSGSELALDIAYQGSHSGHKTIAPFVEYFLDSDDPDDVLDASDVDKLAMAIWATYRRKWAKLWELYMKDYDPLHNYDMQTDTTEGIQSTGLKGGTVQVSGTETLNNTDTTTRTGTVGESGTEALTGTDTSVKTGTQTNTKTLDTEKESSESIAYGSSETDGKLGTETHTDSGTETSSKQTSDNGTNQTDDYLYGFNSTTKVGSDSSEGEHSNLKVESGTVTQSSKKVIDYALNNLKSKSGTDTTTGTETETGTVTDQRQDNLQDQVTHNTTNTTQSTVTNNLTDTTQHTGTIGNSTTTTNNLTDSDEAERVLDEHKYGNIGIASIQRMFKEEVENWKWNYMNDVFADLDAMLVLAVH